MTNKCQPDMPRIGPDLDEERPLPILLARPLPNPHPCDRGR